MNEKACARPQETPRGMGYHFVNGNAMDGDWIAAELHGRECLYSQA